VFVYLAPLKDKSAFKIGKAQMPDRRLRTLAKFYEFDLTSCVVVNCCWTDAAAYRLEWFLHEVCDPYRTPLPKSGGTEVFGYEIFDAAVEAAQAIAKVAGYSTRLYQEPAVDGEGVEEKELAERLAGKVKASRLSLNLSQSKLAEMSGVSRGTVCSIEGGGNVSVGHFLKVCMTLGIDDRLLPGEVETPLRQRAQRRAS
jgi:DNA-binding XRE family transcriptional regulator